jgi:hypothetical protein
MAPRRILKKSRKLAKVDDGGIQSDAEDLGDLQCEARVQIE